MDGCKWLKSEQKVRLKLYIAAECLSTYVDRESSSLKLRYTSDQTIKTALIELRMMTMLPILR